MDPSRHPCAGFVQRSPSSPMVRHSTQEQTASGYRLLEAQLGNSGTGERVLRGSLAGQQVSHSSLLVCQYRHQLGLSSRAACSELPTSLCNTLPTQDVRLPCSSFWPQHLPSSMVRGAGLSIGQASASRNQASRVHGRHSFDWRKPGASQITAMDNTDNAARSRVQDLVEQMRVGAHTNHPSPGIHHRFAQHVFYYPRGQATRHDFAVSHAGRSSSHARLDSNVFAWQTGLSSNRIPTRLSISMAAQPRDTSTDSLLKSRATSARLPLQTSPARAKTNRALVVDHHIKTNQPRHTDAQAVHGCIPLWMGSVRTRASSRGLGTLVIGDHTHPNTRDASGSIGYRRPFVSPWGQAPSLHRQPGGVLVHQEMGRQQMPSTSGGNLLALGGADPGEALDRPGLLHPIRAQPSRGSALPVAHRFDDSFLDSALAPSSLYFYNKIWRAFTAFAQPAASLTELLPFISPFLASLRGSSLSPSIYRVISALKFAFARYFDYELQLSPAQQLAITAVAKTSRPIKQRQREPLTPKELTSIGHQLDLADGDSLRDLTAMSLALRLALRPKELVELQLENITLLPTQARLKFRRFKTRAIPIWENRVIEPIPTPSMICPYALLNLFLAQRRSVNSTSARLFLNSQPPFSQLSPSDFSNMVKKRSADAGLIHLSGHSLRIGTATTLARIGYPNDEIRSAGNWSSSAVEKYIRSSRSWSDDMPPFFPPPNLISHV